MNLDGVRNATPTSEQIDWRPYIFSVLPLSIIILNFSRLVVEGYSHFPAYDDAWMFKLIRQYEKGGIGLTEYLLSNHNDSMVPLLRLIYLVAAENKLTEQILSIFLFGSITGFIISVYLAIYAIGRNAVSAAATSSILAVSQPVASAALSIYQYMGWLMVASCAALLVPVTIRYWRVGSPSSLVMIGLLCSLAPLAFVPGILTLLWVALHYSLLRLDDLRNRGWSSLAGQVNGHDVKLLCVLSGIGITYLLVLVWGHSQLGNTWPGSAIFGDRKPCSDPLNYGIDVFNYGLLGWLWPQAIIDQSQPPFALFQQARYSLLLLGGPGLVCAIVWLATPGMRSRGALPTTIFLFLASLLFTLAVFAGRKQCVPWWNFRYLVYSVTYGPILVGLLLSCLPKPAEVRSRGVVLIAAAFVLYFIAQEHTLIHSQFWQRRFEDNPPF